MARTRSFLTSLVKTLAGLVLLLNLCIATIPRCDSVLNFLQHLMQNKTFSLLVDQPSSLQAEHCDLARTLAQTQIGQAKICECSLVKFIVVRLEPFDHWRYIEFKIQSIALLSFLLPSWNSAQAEGPEPPYPRDWLA